MPGRMGTLIGIATREKSRAAMVEVESIEVSAEAGLAGDFRGKPGNRQVTVLARESWLQACAEIGADDLPWTTRRANLLVEGPGPLRNQGVASVVGRRGVANHGRNGTMLSDGRCGSRTLSRLGAGLAWWGLLPRRERRNAGDWRIRAITGSLRLRLKMFSLHPL